MQSSNLASQYYADYTSRSPRLAAEAIIAALTYLTCAASYKPWTYQKFVGH